MIWVFVLIAMQQDNYFLNILKELSIHCLIKLLNEDSDSHSTQQHSA